jgi:hypothetical protein
MLRKNGKDYAKSDLSKTPMSHSVNACTVRKQLSLSSILNQVNCSFEMGRLLRKRWSDWHPTEAS